MTRKQRHRRLSHLFTIDAHIPKLDAGGSSPLSRSMFSITSENLVVARYRVFEVMRRSTGFNLLIRRGFEGMTSSVTGWRSICCSAWAVLWCDAGAWDGCSGVDCGLATETGKQFASGHT